MISSNFDTEVRVQLARLLYGGASLRYFQEWFAEVAWRLGDEASESHPLSREVDLRLAEFTNGDWTAGELTALFAILLAQPVRVDRFEPAEFGENTVTQIHEPAVPEVRKGQLIRSR